MISISYSVQAYIRNGWEDNIVDPESQHHQENLICKDTSSSKFPDSPAGNWFALKDVFVGRGPDQALLFTNAHIISYFVLRAAVDGMPVCDFKAINKFSFNLFNFVQVHNINVLFEEKVCTI